MISDKFIIRLQFTAVVVSLVAAATTHCSAPQNKAASNALVRVTDETCKEVTGDATVDPDFVKLACAVDAGANIINLLLPRTQWHDILAKKSKLDAGPGK